MSRVNIYLQYRNMTKSLFDFFYWGFLTAVTMSRLLSA